MRRVVRGAGGQAMQAIVAVDKQWGIGKNNGMLLDYIFVSPDLKAEITDCRILKPYRGFDKPSDHVPVCCVLK